MASPISSFFQQYRRPGRRNGNERRYGNGLASVMVMDSTMCTAEMGMVITDVGTMDFETMDMVMETTIMDTTTAVVALGIMVTGADDIISRGA